MVRIEKPGGGGDPNRANVPNYDDDGGSETDSPTDNQGPVAEPPDEGGMGDAPQNTDGPDPDNRGGVDEDVSSGGGGGGGGGGGDRHSAGGDTGQGGVPGAPGSGETTPSGRDAASGSGSSPGGSDAFTSSEQSDNIVRRGFDAASGAVGSVFETGANIRERQRQNRQAVREFLTERADPFGLPTERELSEQANVAIEGAIGVNPQQQQANVRSDVINAARSPRGRAALTGTAGAVAAAEPTPFGEAALFAGGAAAAAAGGVQSAEEDDVARNPLTRRQPAFGDEVGGGEVPVPEDGEPTQQQPEIPASEGLPESEVPVPDRGARGQDSELPVQQPERGSEVDIPTEREPADSVLRTAELVGRQRGRERQRQRRERRNQRGASEEELEDILRGPDEDVTLGEEEPTIPDDEFQTPREFPTGEQAVIGRSVDRQAVEPQLTEGQQTLTNLLDEAETATQVETEQVQQPTVSAPLAMSEVVEQDDITQPPQTRVRQPSRPATDQPQQPTQQQPPRVDDVPVETPFSPQFQSPTSPDLDRVFEETTLEDPASTSPAEPTFSAQARRRRIDTDLDGWLEGGQPTEREQLLENIFDTGVVQQLDEIDDTNDKEDAWFGL